MAKLRIPKKKEETFRYKFYGFLDSLSEFIGPIIFMTACFAALIILLWALNEGAKHSEQHNQDVANKIIECDITCHKHGKEK